jgi:hypothetical protein
MQKKKESIRPKENGFYTVSENVVAREIEEELIIVPLVSGMGDLEDELYSLNETGKAIWKKLDGTRDLQAIAAELAAEWDAPPGEVEEDVMGLTRELLERGMLVEIQKG